MYSYPTKIRIISKLSEKATLHETYDCDRSIETGSKVLSHSDMSCTRDRIATTPFTNAKQVVKMFGSETSLFYRIRCYMKSPLMERHYIKLYSRLYRF